jgi:hypothetical protein
MGQRIVFRHPERRAVREDAGRSPQTEFADPQMVAFELDLGQAPAVGDERLTSRLEVALKVAILLLKMLRL